MLRKMLAVLVLSTFFVSCSSSSSSGKDSDKGTLPDLINTDTFDVNVYSLDLSRKTSYNGNIDVTLSSAGCIPINSDPRGAKGTLTDGRMNVTIPISEITSSSALQPFDDTGCTGIITATSGLNILTIVFEGLPDYDIKAIDANVNVLELWYADSAGSVIGTDNRLGSDYVYNIALVKGLNLVKYDCTSGCNITNVTYNDISKWFNLQD